MRIFILVAAIMHSLFTVALSTRTALVRCSNLSSEALAAKDLPRNGGGSALYGS